MIVSGLGSREMRMPDDGAQPPKTTAIRLESFRDQPGQPAADTQQLVVCDGLRPESGTNAITTSHAAELEVLNPQEDNKPSF